MKDFDWFLQKRKKKVLTFQKLTFGSWKNVKEEKEKQSCKQDYILFLSFFWIQKSKVKHIFRVRAVSVPLLINVIIFTSELGSFVISESSTFDMQYAAMSSEYVGNVTSKLFWICRQRNGGKSWHEYRQANTSFSFLP